MLYYENVTTSMLGLVKEIERKNSEDGYVILTKEKYFMGFKIEEESRLRKEGLKDSMQNVFGAYASN